MNPAPSSGTGLSVSCVSGPSALELVTTTAFERDLRRVRKQGKDLDKLEAIVEILLARQPLPVRRTSFARRVGRTRGLTSQELVLVRTGIHTELFR